MIKYLKNLLNYFLVCYDGLPIPDPLIRRTQTRLNTFGSTPGAAPITPQRLRAEDVSVSYRCSLVTFLVLLL